MRCVIFDLDGTLTQSEEGIWNCVLYTADQMGFPHPDADTLRKFVGPPLQWSFREYMGMTEEQAQEALIHYRRRYTTVGLFENRVYPGIRRLLRTLNEQGIWCAVATGKPEDMSVRILEKFRLSKYLKRIVGTAENRGPDKKLLIAEALPGAWDDAWMVGDTRFDILGGHDAGIRSLGVTYGYGTEEELIECGADALAHSVQEVIDILCPGVKPVKGSFLSMEGMDGCGKTTQINLLTEGLTRYGYEVIHSREPGGCPISEKIRDLVLDRNNTEMAIETEALLYAASRAQHVRQVIRPVIESGKLLLCDRFVDSSIAYQGGGRCLGVELVSAINQPAVDGTMPDATVYLDIDRNVAMSRRSAASVLDRMEMEGDSFHNRVEKGYRTLIAGDPERYIVVDASRKPDEIGDEVLERVLDRLEEVEA